MRKKELKTNTTIVQKRAVHGSVIKEGVSDGKNFCHFYCMKVNIKNLFKNYYYYYSTPV